jgi:hypothetical protein
VVALSSPGPALELVVHHRYTSGSTRDLSGYDNDGYRVPDTGDATGNDATAFDGRATRVVVFPSASLEVLGAVRARARIYVEELNDRRTIVEGYLAFAFAVEADGALTGSVLTDFTWDSVTTTPGAVAPNRWVDVAFTYDGRDTAMLSVDGEVVASRYVPLGPVGGPRWPYGLNIGAWPDGNLRVFKGKIAEVWLWKHAP